MHTSYAHKSERQIYKTVLRKPLIKKLQYMKYFVPFVTRLHSIGYAKQYLWIRFTLTY